jgi:ProP effector
VHDTPSLPAENPATEPAVDLAPAAASGAEAAVAASAGDAAVAASAGDAAIAAASADDAALAGAADDAGDGEAAPATVVSPDGVSPASSLDAPQLAPEPSAEGASAAAPAVADLSPAACAARLAELFPAVFAPGTPKPLKLRIQADIQQRAPGVFNRKSLSGFLHRWTTGTAYLRAMVNAAHRVDLDGLAAGDVADEHRQAATAELERRRALHEARRAAEREAQRQAHAQAHAAARRAQTADDDARRERAGLLHAFETSTLTKANFCALKGLSEADLDARLAQAREARQAAPPPRTDLRPADRGGRDGPAPRFAPPNARRPDGQRPRRNRPER